MRRPVPFTRRDRRLRRARARHLAASRAKPAALRLKKRSTPARRRRGRGAGECPGSRPAPIPAGADAVVMVEETEATTSACESSPVQPGQHTGRRAADITAGQTILRAGQLLERRAASARLPPSGRQRPHLRPARVAVISTGNEIVKPGKPLAPGAIHDIDRFTLALPRRRTRRRPDSAPAPPPTRSKHRGASRCMPATDCTSSCSPAAAPLANATSILDVMRRLARPGFHGISVKPGKPTAFGAHRRHAVLGVPNTRPPASRAPTSCCAGAAPPRASARGSAGNRSPSRSRRIISITGRHQFYTVRIDNGRRACLQGVRRHHQHVAGRQLHRDPDPHRHRLGRRPGQRHTALSHVKQDSMINKQLESCQLIALNPHLRPAPGRRR